MRGRSIGAPIWLGVFALTRISSLSALCAAVAVPPGAYLLGERNAVVLAGLMLGYSASSFVRHDRSSGCGTRTRTGAYCSTSGR